MSKNEWGADPAKYKKLRKPYEDEEHAQVAVNAFLVDIAQLREKHHIAELTVQCQVYIKDGDEILTMHGGAGWGDQNKQAELAKLMFDREFDHLCIVTGLLAARMPGVRRMLLTDPKPIATDEPPARQAETQQETVKE